MRYRIEKDLLGQRQVPAEAYYGIETLRGKENFEITKRGICRQMIKDRKSTRLNSSHAR